MSRVTDFIVSRNVGKYRSRIFRGYVVIAATAFAVLAFISQHIAYFPIDLKIATTIQRFNPTWFDFLMKLVSLPGNKPYMAVIIGAAILFLIINKLRWETVCIIFNVVSYGFSEYLFKDLIHRVRPAEDLVKVFLPLKDYSFPSGHVLGYTAFFGFTAFLIYSLIPYSKIRTFLIAFFSGLVILVSFSRVYLGEHWPSDTLGSYLLGSAILLGTVELYIWGRPKYFRKDPTVKPVTSVRAGA